MTNRRHVSGDGAVIDVTIRWILMMGPAWSIHGVRGSVLRQIALLNRLLLLTPIVYWMIIEIWNGTLVVEAIGYICIRTDSFELI